MKTADSLIPMRLPAVLRYGFMTFSNRKNPYGQRVGGVVVNINEATQHNHLDLFFISPECHSQGVGLAAWRAVTVSYL